MLRRLATCTVAVLALAPAATAAGGGPPAGFVQGFDGALAPNGLVRYVAVPTAMDTVVAVVKRSGGTVLRYNSFAGSWGLPTVTITGGTEGVSLDGKTVVLADAVYNQGTLRQSSRFLIADARSLRPRSIVRLRGDFAYDALSPDARTLYLIQHVSSADTSRYRVRAYDLEQGRLLPRAIADRRQQSWVMQGYPVSRATTADGRWAYTLYRNDGGYPFVHALDTIKRTAVCIGLPWRGNQDALWNAKLRLEDGERLLTVGGGNLHGNRFAIDTRTFRVSRPGGSFPWASVVGGILGGIALAGWLAVALRRRPSAIRARLAQAGERR